MTKPDRKALTDWSMLLSPPTKTKKPAVLEVSTVNRRLVGQISKNSPKSLVLDVSSKLAGSSPFAPPKSLVAAYVNGDLEKASRNRQMHGLHERAQLHRKHIRFPRGIDDYEFEFQMSSLEALYIERLREHLERSYSEHKLAWKELTQVGSIILACERTTEAYTNRFIVREFVARACSEYNVEFSYHGEILPSKFKGNPSPEYMAKVNRLFKQ